MCNETENVANHAKWLHKEDSCIPDDVSDEKPRKSSRVGDEYQAQIPDLMTEKDRLQHVGSSTSQDTKIDDHATIVESGMETGPAEPVSISESMLDDHATKVESGIENDSAEPVSIPESMLDDQSWSEIEKGSFLLGLYLFGKNFRVVNKFIGDKGIRNILPYYYGMFYNTTEYQKWSTFQKRKNKKFVPGKNLFTGWRQKELFARLFPTLTDECKASLAQASRKYDIERLPYETYVFMVRDKVGMNQFIEAVGIGNATQDLTIRSKKPVENELPPISSLKKEQIVDLLKYGIGLSKDRLYDLFWDGVWPCLLGRGWHSEMPKTYSPQNLTENLVFIAPGIKKFSKRGLKKGTDYYESYFDLLNKVAAEPELLDEVESDPDANHESDDDDVMQLVIADSSNVAIGEMMVTMDDLRRSEWWSDIKEDTSHQESQKEDDHLDDQYSLKTRSKSYHPNKNLRKRESSKPDHENSSDEPSPKKKHRRLVKAITKEQPELSKPTDADQHTDDHNPVDRKQTMVEKKRKEKTAMHMLAVAETAMKLATLTDDETDHNGDDSPK